jgi:nicotinamidase-related amidase
MTTNKLLSLREVVGLSHKPANIANSALIMIDCQNTYTRGVMKLSGMDEALLEAEKLLKIAREKSVPIFHIRHDGGEGSPYDINADIGAFIEQVAPQSGESVITKHYPNSFIQTDLDAQLKAQGVEQIILAGFMTHMCVNSTAHGAFNLGYLPTVVASATATRSLEGVNGQVVHAADVQASAIASTRDLYAAIANTVEELI